MAAIHVRIPHLPMAVDLSFEGDPDIISKLFEVYTTFITLGRYNWGQFMQWCPTLLISEWNGYNACNVCPARDKTFPQMAQHMTQSRHK